MANLVKKMIFKLPFIILISKHTHLVKLLHMSVQCCKTVWFIQNACEGSPTQTLSGILCWIILNIPPVHWAVPKIAVSAFLFLTINPHITHNLDLGILFLLGSQSLKYWSRLTDTSSSTFEICIFSTIMGDYKEISVGTLPISKSAVLLTLSFYLVVQHYNLESNFKEFSQIDFSSGPSVRCFSEGISWWELVACSCTAGMVY